MDKNQNKSAKKPEISEEKEFLVKLFEGNKLEIKKIHNYLAAINHNQKIIKKLIEGVK